MERVAGQSPLLPAPVTSPCTARFNFLAALSRTVFVLKPVESPVRSFGIATMNCLPDTPAAQSQTLGNLRG